MDNNENEKVLSDYIDRLNLEQTPEKQEHSAPSGELAELFNTVKLVRSLKEPAMPKPGYVKELSSSIGKKLSVKKAERKRKWLWFSGIASAAVIIAGLIILNFALPFGKTSIVYAMEQAFQEIKAYHGFIEIEEANALGEKTTQAKLEVWANKDGQYYVKKVENAGKDLITVNNGDKKWQLNPEQNQIHVFPAFPDPYRFTFELGKEVLSVKNALNTRTIGEDTISGRKTDIVEVTPKGGNPYKIWIDRETELPLRKQTSLYNSIQYTMTYTQVEFLDTIPADLIAYKLPENFEEIDTIGEQLVPTLEEAGEAIGFIPKESQNTPEGYFRSGIGIISGSKLAKLYYTSNTDKDIKIALLQGKADGDIKPASTAIIGKINGSIAEIQSPVQEGLGILSPGQIYSGAADVNSIRWQQDGFEYAVVGNVELKELTAFVKALANGEIEIAEIDGQFPTIPEVEVPVDLQVEANDQKSVDAGHSPWKLDPVFVAQVFASLKISPEGITGEYPISLSELKVTLNSGNSAIVEVSKANSPVKKIYLKKLIRQDSTGIWTVVGYDSSNSK